MSPTRNSTIDAAGRLVIPKRVREAAGLKPGIPLEVRYREGHVEVAPAPLAVRIEKRRSVAVAVPRESVPSVTPEDVDAVRRSLREEREDRIR